MGHSDDEKVLDAAVAVELLHAESIIHDDIIDQEASRRGRAAFHVRYGYSTSLLTADFVFAMILAIAARYPDRRVATTISNAAMNMCEGEYAELTIDPEVYKLDWEEYLEVISKKTAALFETAVRLGGLVGGASPEKLEALTEYGRNLGIAYQIHDDILDWGMEDRDHLGIEEARRRADAPGQAAVDDRRLREEGEGERSRFSTTPQPPRSSGNSRTFP